LPRAEEDEGAFGNQEEPGAYKMKRLATYSPDNYSFQSKGDSEGKV
jgi:hypothetical protein